MIYRWIRQIGIGVIGGLLFGSMLWGQSVVFQSYRLSTAMPVTGMAFSSPTQGIITTSDSLLFRVHDGYQFQALSLFDITVDNHYLSLRHPFWVNDSTVFVWRTEPMAPQLFSLWRSGNTGRSWHKVQDYHTLDFQAVEVVGDSLFYLSTQDIEGPPVGLLFDGYTHLGTQFSSRVFNPEWDGFPFAGEFVYLGGDSLLLTTQTPDDSLVWYRIDATPESADLEQLEAFRPNVVGDTLSGTPDWHFIELHRSGQILMAVGGRDQATGAIYRSTDAGRTWRAVLPDTAGFRQLQHQNGQWWAFRAHTIWASLDDGVTWQPVTTVDSRYEVFAIAPNGSMWLGGDSGQVAVGRMSNRVRDISHTRAQSSPNLLSPAYPNPFNAQTTIPYTIAKRGHVQLTVYSLRGRRVQTLVNQVQVPGEHTVTFQAPDVPSGIYFVRLQTAGQQRLRKVVLVQ